jgi:hypothetical protein
MTVLMTGRVVTLHCLCPYSAAIDASIDRISELPFRLESTISAVTLCGYSVALCAVTVDKFVKRLLCSHVYCFFMY